MMLLTGNESKLLVSYYMLQCLQAERPGPLQSFRQCKCKSKKRKKKSMKDGASSLIFNLFGSPLTNQAYHL